MATVYKTFLNDDIISTRTLLHEAIPLTGTIVSGTYGTHPNELNIKNYAHGMYQSVYDYPYLSSSANHIFDLTVGFSTGSFLSSSTSPSVQQSKKINIYNQMAQILVGYDENGNIRQFDEDGNLTGGTKLRECIFINFSRLLGKDEIKKGSFSMRLGTGSYGDPFGASAFPGATQGGLIIDDNGKENDYRVNSPAGEYAILSASNGAYGATGAQTPSCGLIFYQAGIVVLSGSIFTSASDGGIIGGMTPYNSAGQNFSQVLAASNITGACDNFRHRWFDDSFNNTTELNSTIHFCRTNHNDFNYSSNPTYLSSSQIRIKNNTLDAPVSYITTIGLYSSDNELLAVAKLSEPLKKDPTNEMTMRVRLDY